MYENRTREGLEKICESLGNAKSKLDAIRIIRYPLGLDLRGAQLFVQRFWPYIGRLTDHVREELEKRWGLNGGESRVLETPNFRLEVKRLPDNETAVGCFVKEVERYLLSEIQS